MTRERETIWQIAMTSADDAGVPLGDYFHRLSDYKEGLYSYTNTD